MARWCFNKLRLYGDEAAVDAVLAAMRGTYSDGSECLFDFERVYPPPSGDTVPADWRYENWGTSRYPVECGVFEPDDEAKYTLEFLTASGPATGVVAALAARHPEVEMTHFYDDGDNGYGGMLTFERGLLAEEEAWEDEAPD